MRKKTLPAPLQLSRETLRSLIERPLGGVVGAGATSACRSAWTCCDSNCTC